MPFDYFKLLVLLIVAALAQAQAEKTPNERCTAEQDFTMECNRCWCFGTAPVCTRMDCKLVPKELWEKVPSAGKQQRFGITMGALIALAKTALGKVALKAVEGAAAYAGAEITRRVVNHIDAAKNG